MTSSRRSTTGSPKGSIRRICRMRRHRWTNYGEACDPYARRYGVQREALLERVKQIIHWVEPEGVCTRTLARGGRTRQSAPEKGWGRTVLLWLGLDTHRRTGVWEGRSRKQITNRL